MSISISNEEQQIKVYLTPLRKKLKKKQNNREKKLIITKQTNK